MSLKFDIYEDTMPLKYKQLYLLGELSEEEFQQLVYKFNPGKYGN
ncbi:MAG: hypothetical protein PHX80_04665 [Candidatus Nanoarchaeia archaeon]|nr:hypothetical protein [Candidatus Nanoarchaeia archaeon]